MRFQKSNFWLAAALVFGVAWAARAFYFRARAPRSGGTDLLERASIKSDVVPGDSCPTLSSWVVSPLQTSVGGWIDVTAAATDADLGDVVTYSWAPSERFEAPGQARTRYRCALPGKQALLLRVSDNRAPLACSTWLRIVVDCMPP
jgi:hypothetical protein